MTMIVVRLLVILFVYIHAKKRGHKALTALLWSVGSAAVPYVILPLYFVFGRKTKQESPYNDNNVIDIEATVVEETINCRSCGNKIKEELLRCPYCQEATGEIKKEN